MVISKAIIASQKTACKLDKNVSLYVFSSYLINELCLANVKQAGWKGGGGPGKGDIVAASWLA